MFKNSCFVNLVILFRFRFRFRYALTFGFGFGIGSDEPKFRYFRFRFKLRFRSITTTKPLEQLTSIKNNYTTFFSIFSPFNKYQTQLFFHTGLYYVSLYFF